MKKFLQSLSVKGTLVLLAFLTVALMSNCGFNRPTIPFVGQSAAQRSYIESTIPRHTGEPTDGAYGLYSYKVYTYSVSMRAVSPIAQIVRVEVFDLNKDGVLDSVWALDRMNWKFASTLDSRFRLALPNTADESIVRDYIGLGYYCKKKTADQKAMQLRRKEAEYAHSLGKVSRSLQESDNVRYYENYYP